MRRVVSTASVLTALLLTWHCVYGDDKEPENEEIVKITTPENGADVGEIDAVEANFVKKVGWPVVLVRPLTGGQPWYAQEVISQLASDGSFSAEVYFGDANTKPGAKFRLMVVIVESKEVAEKMFKAGSTHTQQKIGKLPKSKQIGVVRK